MANTKSKKAPGKLSKVLRAFNPRSFRGGMALFALVFAFTGGGYMLYRSFAYTTPPQNLKAYKNEFQATATDGISAPTDCLASAGQTLYGPLANCIQWSKRSNGSTIGRTGFYSPLTKKFSPTTGWLTPANTGSYTYKCSNIDYYFYSRSQPMSTIYGPVLYGQIYRYADNQWQIKWATKSLINNNCSSTGSWMKALAW